MRIGEALAVVGSLQLGVSGPFECHVYGRRGKQVIVLIDAGAGTHTEQLLQNVSIDSSGASVAAVLITHCHMDHCGGAAEIRQHTGCKTIAPELCRKTLEAADEEGSGLRVAREQGRSSICAPARSTSPWLTAKLSTPPASSFTALHVRGHSRDAHSYLTRYQGRNW